jgi:SET domain-containing protein
MTDPAATSSDTAPPSSLVDFRSSGIHGIGGFALRAIVAGTLIVQYVGERISKAEALRRCEQDNRFIFELDEEWDLDGDTPANPARLLNHSCQPNCEAENLNGQIWIVARRDIAPGEELTFNYGYDLSDFQEHPCRCGSPGCVGFIVAEELFDAVRRRSDRVAREAR